MGQVAVATTLADALASPVADLRRLSNEFLIQLHDVDRGVRIVVDQAQLHTTSNPDLTDPIAAFARDLRAMVEEETRELSEADDLIDILAEIEQLTRTFRPVARSLRRSLTLLTDGRDLMTTWPTKLNQLPPPLNGHPR
jgi:hypothetical protein